MTERPPRVEPSAAETAPASPRHGAEDHLERMAVVIMPVRKPTKDTPVQVVPHFHGWDSGYAPVASLTRAPGGPAPGRSRSGSGSTG